MVKYPNPFFSISIEARIIFVYLKFLKATHYLLLTSERCQLYCFNCRSPFLHYLLVYC